MPGVHGVPDLRTDSYGCGASWHVASVAFGLVEKIDFVTSVLLAGGVESTSG